MPVRPTSFAAHRAITPTAANLRQRVFLFILARGADGATLEEIERGLNLEGNTVRPRRCELEERMLVEDSSRRRKTFAGRDAVVWVIPAPIATKALSKLAAKGIKL